MTPQAISHEQIESFHEAFGRDAQARLALNAVTKNPVHSVALNRAVVASTDHTY